MHLSIRSITAIALNDREASPRERSHLADCTACRTHVQQTRDLRDAVRGTESPAPSSDLLATIHARINAGDRVILPLDDATSPPLGRRARLIGLAAACVLLVAGGLWLERPSPELVAAGINGELHFSPYAPRVGDSVHVEYHASPQLAREDSLTLRARFRTRRDESYVAGTHQQSVTALHRGGDGIFRATFVLPDSALFAAFAVETPDGSRVDSHGHKLWALLVHDAQGRPLYEAMRQRESDLMGRSIREILASAQERVALFPDQPDAWQYLRGLEVRNFGVGAARYLPAHRARAIRLSELWKQRTSVPFSVVDGLLYYVDDIMSHDDSTARAIKAYWRPIKARMLASNSTDPDVITRQWMAINDRGLQQQDSARVALRAADDFWNGAGRNDPIGAMVGFQIAREARDTGIARARWTDRYAAAEPTGAEHFFMSLSVEPALRRDALTRLAALAERLLRQDDGRRPLELTRAEAAANDTARAQRVFSYIGDIWLQLGDTSAARAAFERATATGWDVTLFRKVALAQLAVRDTTRALETFARVAADPSTLPRGVDSMATLALQTIGAARWHTLVENATTTMHSRVLERAVILRVPDNITLLTSDSTAATLQEIARNRITVVTFWSTCCGALSNVQLRTLDSLSARLGRMDAVVIPISEDDFSAEAVRFVRAHGVTVPVYFDHNGAAKVGLDQWVLPSYYVLDARGRVRFRNSSASLVLAQVASLRSSSR